jgi:DNA-binding MarR family transcriptional regulator
MILGSFKRPEIARTREPRASAVGVWLRIMTCNNIVQSYLRERLREEFGVTFARFDMLAQIDRPPRGVTMGELSKRLMVTKGNITDLIGRLEADDLVVRKRCERDQRIQYVHLTARGKRLIDSMNAAHARWLQELMKDFTSSEIAQLYDMMGHFKTILMPSRQGGTPRTSESRGAK